jgi:hypothetical protein
VIITLDLPDHLHEQLSALAEEERRSMNATIVVAVERYLTDRGHGSRVRELARDIARRDAELLRRLGE